MINKLEPAEWLSYNAKLQQKKNKLRKALKEKGVLKRESTNTFDKYKYFSEAQYKELFTELFSSNSLELKFNEIEYETFEGSEKQSNGRMPKLVFTLFDCDTGFYEETTITGEGIDKGDKGGYKAYTGALKYYLANTFMVATGDDPEKDSPSETMNNKNYRSKKTESYTNELMANEYELEQLKNIYAVNKTEFTKFMNKFGKKNLRALTMVEAEEIIGALGGIKHE